jgi:hypothetical protein
VTRHSFPPDMAVDDGVYPFPIAAERCDQCGKRGGGHHPACILTAAAIEQRLREGSPKSGARHVRLTDSVQVGENEFEEAHNIRADLAALAAGVVSALILVVVIL